MCSRRMCEGGGGGGGGALPHLNMLRGFCHCCGPRVKGRLRPNAVPLPNSDRVRGAFQSGLYGTGRFFAACPHIQPKHGHDGVRRREMGTCHWFAPMAVPMGPEKKALQRQECVKPQPRLTSEGKGAMVGSDRLHTPTSGTSSHSVNRLRGTLQPNILYVQWLFKVGSCTCMPSCSYPCSYPSLQCPWPALHVNLALHSHNSLSYTVG